MSVVGGTVIRRIVDVSSGPENREELLASVGLSANVSRTNWIQETVSEEAYYDLLERVTSDDDLSLPFRYGRAVRVDDFGALGFAMKTASTIREAILRLVRYILVLSSTLEYELHGVVGGAEFVMFRPGNRRGTHLANECALAAVISILRQVTDSEVVPVAVSFQHPRPPSTAHHREFFGCPVRFGDRVNAMQLNTETLSTRTRLADEGLSAFILASLDELKQEKEERSLQAQVHSAIIGALPEGRPSKSEIARRLGMSERTLHRRLAEYGETFQKITSRAQLEAAASHLANGQSSLAEVAFLTGFSDQSAFTRAFKNWTGQTPLSFREKSAT
jgi:AraC-like DNA-binding protein